MPKTNLYPNPNPDGSNAERRVEVIWGNAPTGSVQIATTKLQPGANRNDLFAPDISGEGTPAKYAWDGEYVDLTREKINQLIRTLREARTKAFGRDE